MFSIYFQFIQYCCLYIYMNIFIKGHIYIYIFSFQPFTLAQAHPRRNSFTAISIYHSSNIYTNMYVDVCVACHFCRVNICISNKFQWQLRTVGKANSVYFVAVAIVVPDWQLRSTFIKTVSYLFALSSYYSRVSFMPLSP